MVDTPTEILFPPQVIGFDAKTLLHSAHRGKSGVEDISDDKLMKEIDAFMESEEREEMGHEEHLKRLLELNDKAALIHHPVAKVKRQKLLKQEITKTRRKLSMDKAGTTPKRMAAAAAAHAQGGSAAADEQTPKVKGKHKKNREVSPLLESLEDAAAADNPSSGRRLRAAGKEDKASTPAPASGGRCSVESGLLTTHKLQGVAKLISWANFWLLKSWFTLADRKSVLLLTLHLN